MKFKILDKRNEEKKNCFLTKASLFDYITNLPENYQDYEIQREIVSNIYLDNLIETILSKNHIPPIVLVIEPGEYEEHEESLNVKNFKILDGLQRTFRLKSIWDTILLFNKELSENDIFLNYSKFKLSRTFSDKLLRINSSSNTLYRVLDFSKSNPALDLTDLYKENYQWFEIWTDLLPNEEVQKMLVLNAGHKPVKTHHQLELLFRNLLPIIKKVKPINFELIREKELSSTTFSKRRELGQFHFSHLISSILSYKEGKTITTNVDLIQKTQSEDFEMDEYNTYFTYEFFEKFILTLIELDTKVADIYKDLGLKWMGREVSLVGIFAATGNYCHERSLTPIIGLKLIHDKIINQVDKLNLDEYEKIRNNVDLSKINIGAVNKKAIFNAITDLLNNRIEKLNWLSYFKA